jgi:hypothetical protein
MSKVVCDFCINMLMENQFDHSYINNLTFTKSVSRGKLINVSKYSYFILIVQQLENAFQVIVVKENKFFNNVKLNVIEFARRSILSKNTLFFFLVHTL